MLLGCIADDFTGASDLANTLAKGGMRTSQFCGVPATNDRVECEAGVVALKTRSIPATEAVAQSLAALVWLQAQGCQQFFFKYCSTFDSTPEGNIGPVAEALLTALGAEITIVCPAFPATGRSLYMGHLFVKDRLLNESGMENHPLTPMVDADIRRWLARQVTVGVGHVPLNVVQAGGAALSSALAAQVSNNARFIVVDAVADADLLTIGAATRDHRLVTGGSGVALGLPENFRARGLLHSAGAQFTPTQGRGAVLSGSCSVASLQQVEAYLQSHPGLAIEAGKVLSGEITVAAVTDFVSQHADASPIVYSTAEPAAVAASQRDYGRERVAGAIEAFFGTLAKSLVADGVTRLVIGGGETSGAVVTALDPGELVVGPEIDPGVPAMALSAPSPVRLALKSGNFGAIDFFEKALGRLGTP